MAWNIVFAHQVVVSLDPTLSAQVDKLIGLLQMQMGGANTDALAAASQALEQHTAALKTTIATAGLPLSP
jgi:hypothetical protein